MMELTIRPRHPTVLVTSLARYIVLSAGHNCCVWPAIQQPTSSTIDLISSRGSCTLYPGILSSLSRVPPVIPRPRPEIIGTLRPHAARAGARANDTLSPTTPVLCLSTHKCFHDSGHSILTPLSTIL